MLKQRYIKNYIYKSGWLELSVSCKDVFGFKYDM